MREVHMSWVPLAFTVAVLGALTPRVQASGYHVSWTNHLRRLAGLGPIHGTTWDVDAFTNVNQAYAAAGGARVDLTINVPEECATIETAITKGYAKDAGGSNVWTTLIVHSNTAAGSGGVYTNATLTGGYRTSWYPKQGMTLRGEPRTNVTLKGGFYLTTAAHDGFVLDGFRVLEGGSSYSIKAPRFITVYAPAGRTNIFTVRNCHFGPLASGGAMYVTVGAPYGTYTIENNYFEPTPELYLSYGSNVVVQGNFFDGTALNTQITTHRLRYSTFQSNTFANGAMVRGRGDPFAVGEAVTNWVINNNFVNASESTARALDGHDLYSGVIVATNNWWGSINGPYDSTNAAGGEALANTIEVDENSTDSPNFRTHRNMAPEGAFDTYIAAGSGVAGATNVMYVPWATNWLNVNLWPEPVAVVDTWVGNHFAADGPHDSAFGGAEYLWGVNAFTNIQAGVDGLSAGGNVWVAPETFWIRAPIEINAAVSILGTQDVTTVAVAPGATSRCFTLNHASAHVRGVVISNGWANGTGAEGKGGGVYVTVSPGGMGSPVLDACRLVDCRADDVGGGVAFIDTASKYGTYIRDTRVTGCVATNHGGAISASNCVYLSHCLIDNNRALEGKGGGVYVDGHDQVEAPAGDTVHYHASQDWLNQWTVVSNNVARSDGGGAYLAQRTWNMGTVSRNVAAYHEYIFGKIIPNWTFVNNRSLEGSGGGAYAASPGKRNAQELPGAYFYGCTFRANEAADRGGGLLIASGQVDTCTFENNTATNQGGGMFLDGLPTLPPAYANSNGVNPSPWIFLAWYSTLSEPPDGMGNSDRADHRVGGVTSCSFEGNRSGSGGGGGVWATGTGFDTRNSTWSVSNLADNVAMNGSGGGIAAVDTDLQLRFMGGLPSASGNVAGLFGGAIHAARAILTNSTFSGNQAGSGGALYLERSTLDNCIISGNTATHTGGGVYMFGGTSMRSCLVSGNTATNGGGGLYMLDSTNENCTIVNNIAPLGSGVHIANGRMRNAIVSYNPTNSWSISGTPVIEFSCSPDDLSAFGDGNRRTSNPRFKNYAAGDFRLAHSSTCVDGGTNQLWMAGAVDLLGAERISGGIVDMGAYEKPYRPPPLGCVLRLW